MATFLELAQDLARQSGSFEASQLTSVVGQTGRAGKIVNWVQKAYLNIQNSRRDWGWLVSEFSNPLIAGTERYTPASFGLTRFSSWMTERDWYQPVTIYDPAIGTSDETPLAQMSYEYWRSSYGRGDQTSDYWNRPTVFAISPNNEMVFGPIPDDAYVVRGQYQKGPQTLTAAGDIPEMPVRFHDMIMWEALRLMQVSDGSYQESQFPAFEMVGLRHQLELDQLPEVTVP